MKTYSFIKDSFLSFFQGKGHHICDSFACVNDLYPHEDDVMFVNSGMVPFKRFFLNQDKAPYPRVASVQRCLRISGKHNDIDIIGSSGRHHTSFEMMGNFSFGDYFKDLAIEYVWTYLKDIIKIDCTKLFVTVHYQDNESYSIWREYVNSSSIYRMRGADNFWSAGKTGCCGYCTEVFYDFGSEYKGTIDEETGIQGERYLEIWNIVFITFFKSEGGQLTDLLHKCVDTGSGLERLMSVYENTIDNYSNSFFAPLCQNISAVLLLNPEEDRYLIRLICDHVRSVCFLIEDGLTPDSFGQGYVLRRLIRRVLTKIYLRLGRSFLENHPVLDLVDIFVQGNKVQNIKDVINSECSAFIRVVDKGVLALEDFYKKDKKKECFSKVAFDLYDTHGLPLDMIKDLAEEYNLVVNEDQFQKLLLEQKNRSRKDSYEKSYKGKIALNYEKTNFLGYETLSIDSSLCAIEFYKREKNEYVKDVVDIYICIFSETTFYAREGGQDSDRGRVVFRGGLEGFIFHVEKKNESYVHYVVLKSQPKVGTKCVLYVDKDVRRMTSIHHSSVHILHSVLIELFGESIRQRGQRVNDKSFRFDFFSTRAVTYQDVDKVQQKINKKISKDLPVSVEKILYKDAKKSGIISLDNTLYPEEVRVVSFGEQNNLISREMCCGTHVSSLKEIQGCYIFSIISIGKGIKRIEGCSGYLAMNSFLFSDRKVRSLYNVLQCKKDVDLCDRVQQLLQSCKREVENSANIMEKYMHDSFKGTNLDFELIGIGSFFISSDYALFKLMRRAHNNISKLYKKRPLLSILSFKGSISFCFSTPKNNNTNKKYLSMFVSCMKEKNITFQGGGSGQFFQYVSDSSCSYSLFKECFINSFSCF